MQRWRQFLWNFSCLALGAALAAAVLYVEAATRFDPAALAPAPGPLVVDRTGRILRLVPDARGRKAVRLPPGPLPHRVVEAFIAAEDQRFWQHPGVDWVAVLRAAGQDLWARRIVSGASTITQQLARLAYPGPRTFGRKALEMVRSLRLERALAKEEILRHYFDQVPLGYNLVGVEAASLAYFARTAADLTAPQAALLAALAKAPGTLRPQGRHHARLLARSQWVLGRMAHLGFLSPAALAAAREEPLGFQARPGKTPGLPFEAPHFVQLALARQGKKASSPGVLTTGLDLSFQHRAEAILCSHRARLAKCGASQAALVVADNRSLMVLALAGSYRYGPGNGGYNNGATALRSPGSTLKPFLYAQALDQGFTSATVLEDVERRYRTPRGEFLPANFDRSAHGPVPFREALGNSLNLSAVNLLNLVGPASFYETLQTLRLINHPERRADYYGLGLVVGNPEVSLLQLAAAYASLPGGGVFRNLRFSPEEPLDPGVRIFSPQAAYIVSDILADPLARGRIFGGSLAMNQPYHLAVKTGTSTHYRDCWAVAFTPEYTIAVWVGNFRGAPTAYLSGASAAAPIVADLARELFGDSAPAPFEQPEGVTAITVCAFSGLLPGPGCPHQRQEFFIAGSEPARFCTFHRPQDPWHRLDTPFAGWLHQRYSEGTAGRFRLAGFDQDLGRLFPDADPAAAAAPAGSPPHPPGAYPAPPSPTPAGYTARAPFSAPRQAPLVAITYPLGGDSFVLLPPAQTLRLTAKATCRVPLPTLTWFVDGQEVAATGPPFEASLELGRGRHRLLAVGPDGLADAVTVVIQ